MTISLAQKVRVPDDVLVRELDGESVLLNLQTECYFGLDAIGTRMWTLLVASESIEAACEALVAEYDVAPERLHSDVQALIQQLLDQRLIEVSDA